METEQLKKLCCCVLGFFLTQLAVIVLFTYFLIWLLLRPSIPQFILQDASVETFNFSSSTDSLTSSFQITLYSKNPNSLAGIYYDNLQVFATYQGQEITLRTPLPPTYLHHNEDSVWPLSLIGDNMAVAPNIENSLTQDQMAGIVTISIEVEGNIRWKVGSSASGKSIQLNVNCPLDITYGSRDNNGSVAPVIDNYQLVESCNVEY
ncbi:hypothetical protein DCAR_0206970 [Daucus carota subsp. sativus]|uniref:Late embryogenesis abundant protein LEA-2 subgroup domain-containing protein n=1 Tax=Daucus carota subsp. sativus TaxID=79200 RepID=A0A166DK37_DAUCS|nr:PREDICTED: NDR1/HIN1-like protein 12 [Daucus carota subsp. sativus]WOG87739.1 hypothetical protein DCAR_0206970 [Daucus carota subsp. sativus]